MRAFITIILFSSLLCAGEQDPSGASSPQGTTQQASTMVTVPAGTKLLMSLKSGINTRTARTGDGVYLETSFPVTQNNRSVIPPGTYVQGVIDHIQRPGRVKGRAQILFHFTTLIFPSGYTVAVPGAVNDVPGSDNGKVKGKEGTVEAGGQKGRDAGTIASTSGTGALIGGLSRGLKGAAVGGILGGGIGLAEVLLTRGDDLVIPQGSSVEMVLQRPLQLEEKHVDTQSSNSELVPVDQHDGRLEKPKMTPEPDMR